MLNNNLKKGQEISASELANIFLCGNYGGMRRSKRTNSLVLISNHLNKVYNDRWENKIFFFTGMGLKGEQSLEYRQNKTLAGSNFNTINIFLFEVHKAKTYIYKGQVKLFGKPFQEKQKDVDDKDRNVWMFPLKIID